MLEHSPQFEELHDERGSVVVQDPSVGVPLHAVIPACIMHPSPHGIIMVMLVGTHPARVVQFSITKSEQSGAGGA